MHLSTEEHHGIRFTRPLCVPEDAELAAAVVARLYRPDRTVYTQILLVLSYNLDQPFSAVVEQDEVLEEVEEVRFSANALEKRLHIDHAGFVFVKALPVAEKIVRG